MTLLLELMLFGLALILGRNAQKPAVLAKLLNLTRVVQVRTVDARVGRYFVFCGGAVFSRRGVATNPDVSLVWKNAAVAARVLRSPDPQAVPAALANGSLTLLGNGDVANWFGDVVRAARGGAHQTTAVMPTVAVIGLGRMGSGIARSLLHHGFPVVVYNRTADKAHPLVELGAQAAATPAAAARGAQFVVTSLLSDAAVMAVMDGPDGILAGIRRGAVHVGASTISADGTRRLASLHAERGGEYLAAPVVGRPDAAAAGELVALVCGKRSVFDTTREVLGGFTRQVQYLGEDHALASAAKLAVNYSAATIIDLMGQVYTFGEKAGIPLNVLHMVFRMMWAQPALQGYATRMFQRDFDDVGFDLQGGLKDVTLMVNAAKALGVRWDFADVIQRKMVHGIEMGLGARDWSSTYEVTRQEAGLGA